MLHLDNHQKEGDASRESIEMVTRQDWHRWKGYNQDVVSLVGWWRITVESVDDEQMI